MSTDAEANDPDPAEEEENENGSSRRVEAAPEVKESEEVDARSVGCSDADSGTSEVNV